MQVWEFVFRKVWKLNYEIDYLSVIFKEFCLLLGVTILRNTSELLFLTVDIQNIYPEFIQN